MFKVQQITNNRWRVTADYDVWSSLPTHVALALLWRTFDTAQEAFAFACEEYFKICDRRAQ